VIGGGPAGLMAAEVISMAGVEVDVYDAMPSVGRKFLLAGIGGLNLTHSEPFALFLSRYAARAVDVAPWLDALSPDALCEWTHALGIETFVGTSGRVFPTTMKAAPLLRAWLQRLRGQGVRLHVRHRWQGWQSDGALQFATPTRTATASPRATVLACGGASWPRLGSDAAWVPWLAERDVGISPLRPANCGFDAAGRTGTGWSEHLQQQFAGAPLKNVRLSFQSHAGEAFSRVGECVLTRTGVEGSLIYAASAMIRDDIAARGSATVMLNLLPQRDAAWVDREVASPRGRRSLATHLERLGIKGVKRALLNELLTKAELADPVALARAITALPVVLNVARPIAEAISTAGGVRLEDLTSDLMCKAAPGVFCAGEMLDWEAPTGGYLLTATMASGRIAGQGVLRWLAAQGESGRKAT
jgi:uncharacterized flavoprotein (TIGR03862 family)